MNGASGEGNVINGTENDDGGDVGDIGAVSSNDCDSLLLSVALLSLSSLPPLGPLLSVFCKEKKQSSASEFFAESHACIMLPSCTPVSFDSR